MTFLATIKDEGWHVIMDFNCFSCMRSKSPKPIKQCLDKIHKCANSTCVKIIKSDMLYIWRSATDGTSIYRFCSDNCWSEWQDTPRRYS